MNLVKGDLWDELGKADLLLVTTNSTLSRKGELVMGAGSALEAKKRFPVLPERWGRIVSDLSIMDGIYGIIVGIHDLDDVTCIGAFQTKTDWRKPSNLKLIKRSCGILSYITCFKRIVMPFPGIANGGLTREEVLPVISTLSDNVYVYERE